MLLPSGSRTTRSGRRRPVSDHRPGCSSKSQRCSMPASSTTRRSCISPQRPRTEGVRSARDKRVGGAAEGGNLLGRAARSDAVRSFSTAPSRSCTCFIVSVSGCTSASIACLRASICAVDCLVRPSKAVRARSRKAPRLLFERFGGQRLERVAQVQLGLVEQRLRGAERRLLPLELVPQPLVVLARRGQLAGRAPRGHRPARGRRATRAMR